MKAGAGSAAARQERLSRLLDVAGCNGRRVAPAVAHAGGLKRGAIAARHTARCSTVCARPHGAALKPCKFPVHAASHLIVGERRRVLFRPTASRCRQLVPISTLDLAEPTNQHTTLLSDGAPHGS